MSGPAYLPLFGSDYLADTRHLSTEEHGAYLLLMMAAWRQDDCDLPADDHKLARIVGLTMRKWLTIKATILEFWTVENGRIFQARLRKERGFADQKSESNRQNARKRWNAQVVENNEGEPCERSSERNAPQPQPQKEEVISPKGDCPSDDGPVLRPEHIVEEWNKVAPRLAKPLVRNLTPERRQLLKARIAQYDLDDFLNVFGKIERSPFLRGDTGWRGGNFDWFFKKANFQKTLEGNYDQ